MAGLPRIAFSRSLLAAAALTLAACQPKAPPPPAAPPDVQVMTVLQRDEPVTQEWIGTLDGFVNAEIRAQVSGYLLRQDYTDGKPVKKGDLLFEIDPRPFQAAYDQIQATFKKSELDLKRQAELIQTQAVAQQEYDNAVQTNLADKAALEEAQLNLTFSKITSPVDGIAGIATGQLGDLVGPTTGILTTVSQVNPIKAYFPVSEETYLSFFRSTGGHAPDLSQIQWELVLADGTVYPRKGTFFAADREISADTGTLRMVATFPNPDLLLRPGQYARVRAVVRTDKGSLLIPQRAVTELQGAYQVAVVDDGNVAHLRAVTVGQRVGSDWVITAGLHPGEVVVADGLQKVKDGAAVTPHPFVPPAAASGGQSK
jgi:RND family efflux transporter MFP subunit